MHDRDELRVRRASSGEAETLTEIALAAKGHWQNPEEWMALWRESLTVTDGYLEEHDVFVGEVGGKIAGFYALARPIGKWELDHLWIKPESIRRGIGRALFTHAVERLTRLSPGAILEIESDPNAEAFYLRMGAKRVGKITRDWHGLKRTLPQLQFATKAS